MALKREMELEGSVTFPLVKKKTSENIVAQLWAFLNQTLDMKKEFRRSIFRNHVVTLSGRRYWFRIYGRAELQFFFHVADTQFIREANRHGELILGFFNTLHREDLRHAYVVGSFSTNDPKLVPRKAASLIDRTKLVQLSNSLRAALKPMGQLIELTIRDENWLITTANFDHFPMAAFFFHIPKQGAIPSDLIRSTLQSCIQLGKRIKRPLNSV